MTVDWRGQGFSDRLLPDARIGHVLRFADYQGDLAALLAHADARALPRPWHMLAHSMGGAIGLRALLGAHPFASAAFSAPMWGLAIAPSLRGVAKALPRLAQRIGLGHRVTPTTATETYFLVAPFAANLLTTDREHWDYMVRMARAEDRLRLGGPSLSWLAGALEETRALRAAPRPRLPAHAAVGEMEKIVDPEAVRAGMADWPGGSFAEMPLAEHELLMEAPAIRARFLDRVLALYASVEGGPSRQGRSTA